MERSLHSRGFRTPCTFRHRCRQSPQRSIRFPSRSMWMIMYLSVSSTLVTVCAFNLSCFLRNASMSTSILFLSVAVHHSPQKIRCIGDSDQPLHRQPAASKTLRLQLHFRDGNPVLVGQAVGLLSGLCLIVAASLQSKAVACFVVLLLSRLILGCGESCVATGAITWGLGRVDATYAAQVISWSGIASYGAMAAGAPLGIWLETRYGLESIGVAALGESVPNLALALPVAGVPTLRGAHLAFSSVLGRVSPHGLGLTLGTVGFAAIATFTGLYYASRHWTDPALALMLFGTCFIVTRLLFASAINRWDGFRVAMVSFILESAGLFVLWSATTHDVALAGAGLSGCGFALVFPALGVEALKMVADQNHGAALGVYTAFLDLAMGITGPIAGVIVGNFGSPAVFLYGSGAASCAIMLTLLLYHLVREPHERLSQERLEPLETGETR